MKIEIKHSGSLKDGVYLRNKLRYRFKKLLDAWELFHHPSNKIKEYDIEKKKFYEKLMTIGNQLKLKDVSFSIVVESPGVLKLGVFNHE